MNEQTIFTEALERTDPRQRNAFLDQACQGDPALRQRIDRLLAQHQHGCGFLESPPLAGSATVDQPVHERPGTTIGPYKLIEQIGEGGMGSVWMSQQSEPVKRLVAVKLIKAGMDSAQVIARFEAERQALALMDHANIARVLDAGATEAGRPYFVMDLVRGVPITRYCDEHHLTPRQRLELFIPVCQAIQHAHQKGIIHRDLKPSNVLVALYDGKPVPKVIDFGVAKATGQSLTDKTLVTGFGNIVGTLEYMSPEQAEFNQLDIDTRSDIYSLGVLLYELLTGSPPFSRKDLEKAGMLEMLRVIREEEPSKPSTKLSTAEGLPTLAANRGTEPAKLTKLVRGELDWIVMKALDKDRNRRYETANGFAADLERYLADEPVQACPPSAGYRLRKFVRRNKGPVVAVSVVLLALIGGIVGTSWGLIRADKARKDAVDAQHAEAARAEGERLAKDKAQKAAEAERKAKNAESAQRRRAEDNARLAIAVLDEIITKEARKRLTLYLRDEPQRSPQNPEREKLEREFLEKGLKFYEQLAQANATDWTARRERAKAYANVGLVRLELKNHVESEKAFRQAVQLTEELAEERPGDFDNRFDVAYNYHLLCRPNHESRQFAAAEQAARRALVLFEKLAADFPDRSPAIREHRASAHQNLGGALLSWAVSCRTDGQLQEAEKLFRQAAGEFESLRSHMPNNTWAIHELGYIYLFLGELLSGLGGRDEDAEKAYQQSVAYHEQQLAQDPEKVNYQQRVTWSYAGLARLLRKNGRRLEASPLDAKRTSLLSKLASNSTQASELNNLAWHFAVDPDPQLRDAVQAVELAKKAVDLEPTQGSWWNTLGTAHYRAGSWQAAIEALRNASELYQGRYFGHDAFFIAMAHWQLGEMESARKWYAAALIWMQKHAPKNEELVRFRAEASALVGLPEELSPEQEVAKADDLSFYTLILGADPNAAWARGARGTAYAERGQWQEAAADFARAAELNESEPLYCYREALTRLQLGDVTSYRQICAAALARLDPARKTAAAHWPVWNCVLAADAMTDWNEPLWLAARSVADNPKSYRALNLYGAVLYRAGQYQEALERLTEAEQAYQPDDGKLDAVAYNWLFLAMAHHRLGHAEEAKKWRNNAVQWIDQETENKPKEPSAATPLPWNRRLTLQLLRREAESLQ